MRQWKNILKMENVEENEENRKGEEENKEKWKREGENEGKWEM